MILEFPLPKDQVPIAREWLDNPVPGRDAKLAATAILLKPTPGANAPFDVYMIERSKTMAHSPGVCAFPGGSVRPDDDDLNIPILGRTIPEWASIMSKDETTSYRVLLAAARETFEESRVLLARAEDGAIEVSESEWEEPRRRVESHELDFGDLLRDRGLNLDLREVGYRGMWTTPDFLPRRYAVAFFTIALPEGQSPILATTEATSAGWATAQDYLDRDDAGDIVLLAPTRFQLEELARAESIADALESRMRNVMFVPAPNPSYPSGYCLYWEG